MRRAMLLYVFALVPLWFIFRRIKESKRVPNCREKYVFITGCDTGFGNQLARHLDELGYRVIAGCYTEKGEDGLRKISSQRLTTARLDVSDSSSVKETAAFIKTLVGEKGLWAVVNNAGTIFAPAGPTDWLTVDDYKSTLAINLFGLIDVTLSVLPLVKKARGRVVNISSVCGRITSSSGPYCTSKYGVESFTDSLRLSMAAFGVKVSCIEPGTFKTNEDCGALMNQARRTAWDRAPQDVKDDYGERFLEQLQQITQAEFNKMHNTDLTSVLWCMEHAIAAVHPRTRYSAGWDAKLFWLPLSYMPTCVTDTIFLRLIPKLKISQQ